MAKRTSSFSMLPWEGGVVTSIDESLIQPNQLTVGDNLVSDYTLGRKRREGINYDWDDGAPGTAKVVGGLDYWFGNEDSRAHFIISVLSDGTVYRTVEGDREQILPGGSTPWTIPPTGLTEANLEVINNLVVIAVSGPTNQMKYWNGDTATPLRDLPGNLLLTSVDRSSSGTTRTVKFSGLVTKANGDTIIIQGGPDAYNGTYTVLSGGGTNTITYTASPTLTESVTADTALTVGGFAPLALFLRNYQNRLFTNDKQNLDRLHYCGSLNPPFQWGGVGDSGSFDIGIGDGDPAGISGIAPPFKGDLFVGKRTKLYRLPSSADLELASIITQSNGIGFLSHQGITAIDQDDIFFVSDRGIHSLNSTNAYGDFTAGYISADIQRTFVEKWSPSRRKFIKAVYFPELNSAAFAVTESSTYNNALWLYNVPKKQWTRWPGVEAEALISVQDTDRRRAYFGTLSGRLARTLTGSNQDTDETGITTTIKSKATSGIIYLEGRPDIIRGFKKLSIIFRGSGSYTITAKIKIDNFSEQAVAFVSNQQEVPLGQFILGQDILGGSFVTAPYSLPIDGYGRGFRISVEQSDLNTGLAILGFMVEFEAAGDSQETRTSETGSN